MPVHLDMIVDVRPRFFPLGIGIGHGGQRTESWTVERRKEAGARPRQFFEWSGVESPSQSGKLQVGVVIFSGDTGIADFHVSILALTSDSCNLLFL